ncbi:1,4-dihydroxy-6-naphthoate synthase [Gorillibacterium sp. CAU 1737]|uniref:1,4-dihydroxy-6-naphthoate synthase n=1 Tax=Gorillibacterium sp. CAU 1737 TaxID=3140362 RepID=UPI0032613B7C
MMVPDDVDFFCKLFIDTDHDREKVISFVSESIAGRMEGWCVSNPYCSLYLVKNDDFHVAKRLQRPDGFLFSRYYLEIEPNEGIEPSLYYSCVSELLTHLWSSGYPAIAACDFEEMLPRQGGYNRLSGEELMKRD